jgi:hypothetical protein
MALLPKVAFPYTMSAYVALASSPVVFAGTPLKPGGKRYAVSQYLESTPEPIDAGVSSGMGLEKCAYSY